MTVDYGSKSVQMCYQCYHQPKLQQDQDAADKMPEVADEGVDFRDPAGPGMGGAGQDGAPTGDFPGPLDEWGSVNKGFVCKGEIKEDVNQGGGRMDSRMCIGQCEEISYFETGLEMCCQWDGEVCQLHYGFEAAWGGNANTTFSFVKDYRSVSNDQGKVHRKEPAI